MTAQTAYSISIGNATPGLLADINDNEIDSFLAEEIIPFGVVVQRGTSDKQVLLGGDALGIGISVRDLAREGAPSTGAVAYADEEAVGVLRRGKIFVTIPSGGSAGDPINYVDATGVIDAGAPIAGETAIAGATLEEDVVAGAIGAIRVTTWELV